MQKSDKKTAEKISDRRSELSRRFLDRGSEGLSSEEILELMLYFSVPKDSAAKTAEKLLEKFGGISAVLDADPNVMMKAGISENTAVFFRMLTAVAGRYYSSLRQGMKYDSTDKLIELFRPHYAGIINEEFRVACFREDMSLITSEAVSRGSGARTEVSLRALTELILSNDCSLAAVSHNHPNASAEPSDTDLRFTKSLYGVLKMMDIELVDHIIIGKGSEFSVKDKYPQLFSAKR